jgi:Arf-GAP with dual PH domain-containing protein
MHSVFCIYYSPFCSFLVCLGVPVPVPVLVPVPLRFVSFSPAPSSPAPPSPRPPPSSSRLSDPDWTSINLGIFLCIECAGVHRNLGVHHSKVRSITLDTSCWDAEQVTFMRGIGNVRAREMYEYNAPGFYVRPTETKSPIVRENWIRAKYVRKEFVKACEDDEKDSQNPAVFDMPEQVKEGAMSKLNPKGAWQKRWFILHRRRLYWFKAGNDSYAKGNVDVTEATFEVPARTDPKERFVFHVVTTNKTYPLACENMEEMFNWLHALRRARIFFSRIADGKTDEKEEAVSLDVVYKDLGEPIKSGELTKQGGSFKSWKKRFCAVANGSLYYFKHKPMNADVSI